MCFFIAIFIFFLVFYQTPLEISVLILHHPWVFICRANTATYYLSYHIANNFMYVCRNARLNHVLTLTWKSFVRFWSRSCGNVFLQISSDIFNVRLVVSHGWFFKWKWQQDVLQVRKYRYSSLSKRICKSRKEMHRTLVNYKIVSMPAST